VEQPPDAPVILVAHDDDRGRLGFIKGAVVERANLPVIAAGIGDANEHATRDEERIELLVEFVRRQRTARRRLVLRRGWCRPPPSPRPRGGGGGSSRWDL